MNQEITLNDYQSIGTMETALSEHADEAFFELSPERQKIAEKIFKCLTETDGENREIRRAMTVEKLCAVADADFSEVASVIEVFRKDGRTFLMPPPEVPLNENSLIDISHESLIRKWERLKKWVEEEGQSSRTYRRLAEDALLHQQNKMGFWSDPELKDALEWRENFKPNETWAQLYKETGEKQYKASFDESIKYLNESKIDRNKKISKEKRQRTILVVLSILFFMTTLAAVYAAYTALEKTKEAQTYLDLSLAAKNSLETTNKDLENSQQSLEKTNDDLELSKTSLEKTYKDLENSQQSLEKTNDDLEISLEKAEEEKKRADSEAEQAKLSEAEKQKALEEQKLLRADAENKRIEADDAKKRAEIALAEIKANAEREETNRSGLVFLEQGEFKRALPEFQKLLASYEDESKPMPKESRSDGKWWAFHNLGIVKSKLPNTFTDSFRETECSYNKALNVLQDKLVELKLPGKKLDVSKCPPEQSENSGQNIAPNVKREEEINRSQVTTLRRLAQFYREEAQNTPDEKEAERLNTLAVENYNKILKILPQEFNYQKQETYPAALYVELADTLSDLNVGENNKKVTELYEKAAKTYEMEQEFVNQIEALKKWSDFDLKHYENLTAIDLLKQLVEIQENKLNLSPFDLEIAETYNTIDKAYSATTTPNEAYGELSRIIVDFDRVDNKKSYMEKVENLANAYIKIGKCRKAEKVYLIADGDIWKGDSQNFNFLIKIGQFYKNTLHDNKNAETFFAKFVEVDKNSINRDEGTRKLPIEYERIGTAAWIAAGDFYFDIKNYEKAEEIYERAKAVNKLSQEKIKEAGKIAYSVEEAELIVKVARVYEAHNKLDIAEAKYSEAVNLVTKLEPADNSNNLIPRMARVLIDQADFYERRGNKQKAQDIYIKTEAILRAIPATTPTEQVALQVYVHKKLGDINRDNIKIADHYYSRAINFIVRFRFPSTNEDSRYYKNNKLTAKFHSDLAEIYESKISLNSTENTDVLKTKAQEARKEAEKLKLEEQKPVCEENK